MIFQGSDGWISSTSSNAALTPYLFTSWARWSNGMEEEPIYLRQAVSQRCFLTGYARELFVWMNTHLIEKVSHAFEHRLEHCIERNGNSVELRSPDIIVFCFLPCFGRSLSNGWLGTNNRQAGTLVITYVSFSTYYLPCTGDLWTVW